MCEHAWRLCSYEPVDASLAQLVAEVNEGDALPTDFDFAMYAVGVSMVMSMAVARTVVAGGAHGALAHLLRYLSHNLNHVMARILHIRWYSWAAMHREWRTRTAEYPSCVVRPQLWLTGVLWHGRGLAVVMSLLLAMYAGIPPAVFRAAAIGCGYLIPAGCYFMYVHRWVAHCTALCCPLLRPTAFVRSRGGAGVWPHVSV